MCDHRKQLVVDLKRICFLKYQYSLLCITYFVIKERVYISRWDTPQSAFVAGSLDLGFSSFVSGIERVCMEMLFSSSPEYGSECPFDGVRRGPDIRLLDSTQLHSAN